MKNRLRIIEPAHSARPRGYSNGVLTSGPTLHIAGQIGWNRQQELVSEDFVAQFRQALANVLEVVAAAGGSASDVARMTIYVTDLPAYRASLRPIGAIWRELLGKHFPAMALVGVTGLVEPGAKVEIEAVAVMPEDWQESA